MSTQNHSLPAGVPTPKLDDLYQEVILDHNRRPRNFKKIEDANAAAHGVNPLCGDDYELFLSVDKQGVIADLGFQGCGCAISKSSASMMTQLVKGKTLSEARKLKDAFVRLLTAEEGLPKAREAAGRMKIFEGVKQFPVRVKCATLIWHTLADAMQQFTKHRTTKKKTTEKETNVETKKEVQIRVEVTPNPNTMKFNVSETLLASGTLNFQDPGKAKGALLPETLFGVENVLGVMVGPTFVTVTRVPQSDWHTIVPAVTEKIREVLLSGRPALPVSEEASGAAAPGNETERKIIEILDHEIRPAVNMDGGDITFHGYKDGVVTLYLQGSCSSCPSAIMTLKQGVETRLKQAIPEIKEVVQV